MPTHLPQPHPDPPFGDRLGGLIGRVREALVGRHGQTLPGTPEATPPQQCIGVPARPAEAQRLLSATIDENRNLTAHVRELEAELRSSSAEVAKLRGQLRGAVQDALTDSLTRLANRRSFDLECAAVVARASKWSPAHLGMADIDHFVVRGHPDAIERITLSIGVAGWHAGESSGMHAPMRRCTRRSAAAATGGGRYRRGDRSQSSAAPLRNGVVTAR
jgi:hypothetical protein